MRQNPRDIDQETIEIIQGSKNGGLSEGMTVNMEKTGRRLVVFWGKN